MNKRILTGILIAVVGCGLVVLGIFITSQLVKQWLAPLPPPTQQAGETVPVVVASHNITLGTVLKAEDLRILDVPISMAPAGTLDNVENAVGKFPNVDMAAGEILLVPKLADPTNVNHDLSFIVQDNQVLMAFPATDLMSTLNILQRGDVVDILASIETDVQSATPLLNQTTNSKTEETGKQTYTFDALQRIQVSAVVVQIIKGNNNASISVGGANPTPVANNPETKTMAYMLALNPQDALVIKHLKDIGADFDIVLRAADLLPALRS